jgi:hypothetical protein
VSEKYFNVSHVEGRDESRETGDQHGKQIINFITGVAKCVFSL